MKYKYPEEVKIYHSKGDVIITILLGLFFTSITVSHLFKNVWHLVFLAIIIARLLIYIYFKRFYDETPQIIVNEKGIQFPHEKIIYWGNIGYIGIREERINHISYFLDVHAKNKNRLAEVLVTIEIGGLNLHPHEILNLLVEYRDKRRKILKYYKR